MEYTFNIFEKTDEENRKHFFVFDSFNTCLGYFNNIDLAYGLINIYLRYLEEIYEFPIIIGLFIISFRFMKVDK